MPNQINYEWRVTKYNPDFRDEDGYFTLREEWTCPSEIGKTIDGKKFTLEEYLRIEEAYVNTVITFFIESGLSTLRVLQLSEIDISKEDMSSELYEVEFDELNLVDDKKVDLNEIRTICKMVLRNFAGCHLYSKNQFFVHFGWDYYMYIGSSVKSSSSINFARDNGLFVEEMSSPYYFSENEVTRTVQWNEKTDEDMSLVGEEKITGIPLDEYRKLFHLSEEHPVIGYFELTNNQADFLQKYLKHKMDFSKYEYGFCGYL